MASYYPYTTAYLNGYTYPSYTVGDPYKPINLPYIQPTPSQQTAYPNVNVVWISNEKEADNYPVGPNAAVALWDYNNAKIYLKQADATGKPSVKIYTLSEDKPIEKDISKSDDKVYGEFKDALESLKREIESMKQDMYGLAGKKKTSHKAEED